MVSPHMSHQIGTVNLSLSFSGLSQMVTYLVCDDLKYGFKSAYEQS